MVIHPTHLVITVKEIKNVIGGVVVERAGVCATLDERRAHVLGGAKVDLAAAGVSGAYMSAKCGFEFP